MYRQQSRQFLDEFVQIVDIFNWHILVKLWVVQVKRATH